MTRHAVADVLDGFEQDTFTADGTTRVVYRRGVGPAVIVMTEIPGITPAVLRFAQMVVDLGCSVTLPHLFGEDGRPPTMGYTVRSLTSVCISRQFNCLALGTTSPVTPWLRALVAHEHERCGGPGVGAVGMCFTGGFALGLMVDDAMIAPVLSQPSVPFPLGAARRADVGLSPEDLARIQQRAEAGVCVLGLRFTGDRSSPPERFEALTSLLGDSFIGVELDSSKGNPYGHKPMAHSVLTEDLDNRPGTPTRAALDQVLAFFAERLLPERPTP